MTWTGRQLTGITQNGQTASYKYDVDGLRLEKTANGITTEYQYVNGQLLGEKRSNGEILRYTYDPLGALSSIQYKNTAGTTTNYIVRCTLSGDVDQIFNTSGNLVARYIYDTWGNTVSVTDASGNAITSTTHIANINPIRYRGYYWDKESELYYLQSRYYDTVTQRYVNADGYVFTGQDMQSCNMYAYCGNNPVTRSDPFGGMYVTEDGNEHLSQQQADVALKNYQKKWRIQSDKENFDWNNTDENKVIKSTCFSAYKGTLYVKAPIDGGLSLGIVFLDETATDYNLIRHERGHVEQLARLGFVKYMMLVGIPSFIHCRLYDWDRMNDDAYYSYYSVPWEYEADLNGSVEGRSYDSWAKLAHGIYQIPSLINSLT